MRMTSPSLPTWRVYRCLAAALILSQCGRSATPTSDTAPSPSLTARGHVGAGTDLAAWDSASCPALAQVRARAASGDSARQPTIILCAGVGAREVHFATQPDISVRLTGSLGDSVRVLERRNLPKPVVAGVTYRDVYIAVEIVAHLTDSCRQQTGADTARAGLSPSLCASILRADSARGRPE
jgi:hypothetical protein